MLVSGSCSKKTHGRHILRNDQTDTQWDPLLMFTELSLHCVKPLELTTAALLSHSSKVFYEIRLFCQTINNLPLWMMSIFKEQRINAFTL